MKIHAETRRLFQQHIKPSIDGSATTSTARTVVYEYCIEIALRNLESVKKPIPPTPASSLSELLKQRRDLAVAVARCKWRDKAAIFDAKREADVLATRRQWAVELGVELQRVKDIEKDFRDLMTQSKDIQERCFAEWNFHPRQAIGTSLSLTTDLRPRIDAVDRRIIRRLGSNASPTNISDTPGTSPRGTCKPSGK